MNNDLIDLMETGNLLRVRVTPKAAANRIKVERQEDGNAFM